MKNLLTILSYLLFFYPSTILGQTVSKYDSLQFPKGYPESPLPVITQLQSYPLPRYLNSNNLLRLFNWMNPAYMGGNGQKGINQTLAIKNSYKIQEELILNWNYGIVISNTRGAFSGPKIDSTPLEIHLANQYPTIPLHVITFWMQLSPKSIGLPYKQPLILNKNLDSSLYINYDFYGKPKRDINFLFPDSFIRMDGLTQKSYIDKIVKYLKRPIDMINENGEEPPGPYMMAAITKDTSLIRLKNDMKIDSWEDFMAMKKLHLRQVYVNSFMKEIPELKNTKFSFYSNEGGPINCFEWSIMKKIATPVNNNYYSTPDFYPRWPKNWKDWQGPWHGWKWIETGRIKEIKDGDNLFSPFVAAGWSKTQEEDIRPAQWLGLLKCLAGVGAEFYYVGYFSLSTPFTNPSKWTWQAAMPSYAQAITSRFEDVLKDGNVLFDNKENPIITYRTSDKHVLVTVRKHHKKEKYIICGTYQPFSNELNEIPDKKNVTIQFDHQELTFEIRRQGSVYVYEKTAEGKTLFYQLDKWHENAHPDYWRKDFYFEAEVADTSISNNHLFTINKNGGNDYTDYISYISLDKNTISAYRFTERDSMNRVKYFWIKYKGDGILSVNLTKTNSQEEKLIKTDQWKWHKIKLMNYIFSGNETLLILHAKKGLIDIDKLIITEKDTSPND